MRAFLGCTVGVTAVLVAVVLVTTQPNGANANIGDLLSKLFDLTVQDKEIYILDKYCTMKRRPYIKSGELHYKASLTCPGWTTIRGRGDNHTNPDNSERDATIDFMTQAVERGLVTAEEAAPWLA